MSRTVVITGTRTGIGRGLADHFLGCGDRVIGCSRQASTLEHPKYSHHTIDVGDEASVIAMVRETVRQHGVIDALINNAGTAAMNALLLTPGSTLESLWRTNVAGSFFCLREVGKVMSRQKHGRIINFSTIAVPLDLSGEAVYAASKAVIESLTRVAARELGGYGITVNAVGPNPVDTALVRSVPTEKIRALVERQPIPRLGTVADVANVVEFFLRPESSLVTGQVIYLGGIA